MKSVKNKPRIVLDTNIWISGFVFAGQPGLILELFGLNELRVVISEELLSELRRVIAQRFPLFEANVKLLIEAMRQHAVVVQLGGQTVSVSRDPDDNKVIETALIGACQYIVTGDKDLLVLESYKNILIVTPMTFLDLLK